MKDWLFFWLFQGNGNLQVIDGLCCKPSSTVRSILIKTTLLIVALAESPYLCDLGSRRTSIFHYQDSCTNFCWIEIMPATNRVATTTISQTQQWYYHSLDPYQKHNWLYIISMIVILLISIQNSLSKTI